MNRFESKYLLFILLLLNTSLAGVTRDNIITSAGQYRDLNWNVYSNNILDTERYWVDVNDGYKVKKMAGSDGIDDRMLAMADVNDDKVINILDITTENIKNWPFVVGHNITGEAYAWGYGHTKENFTSYLQQGRIAGARDGDPIDDKGTDTRFTGLDCSGLITKLWHYKDPNGHLGTGELSAYAFAIDGKKLRVGDFLLKDGHVVLFKNWIQAYTQIGIVHAVK